MRHSVYLGCLAALLAVTASCREDGDRVLGAERARPGATATATPEAAPVCIDGGEGLACPSAGPPTAPARRAAPERPQDTRPDDAPTSASPLPPTTPPERTAPPSLPRFEPPEKMPQPSLPLSPAQPSVPQPPRY